jgi:hypothetical protein
MAIRSKKTAAGLAIGVAALGGGGIAYAAAQSGSDPRAAFEADVAKRLGVTQDKLDEALKGAAADQVDRALADGKITEAQADELKQRIQSGNGPAFGGPGFFGGSKLHAPLGPGGPLEGAVSYLGLTEAQLRDALASGKSLADVADDEGKSVDGLKSAIIDAATSRLDAAVKAGDLTSSQRDEILQGLKSHVDDLVNGKLPDRARMFFRHP